MAHYATRYEVAIETPEGGRQLVTYTARKSRQGIGALLRSPAILAAFEGACIERAGRRAVDGYALTAPDGTPRARLFFTGRTERDASSMGELPRFGGGA